MMGHDPGLAASAVPRDILEVGSGIDPFLLCFSVDGFYEVARGGTVSFGEVSRRL
jgi:hypothetical protein